MILSICGFFYICIVGTGVDVRFTSRAYQQALATSPFGNTCKVDAASPEETMGGLQDKDVYNQGNIKWVYYNDNTSYIYHSTI
jgi:hypothetical protein